MTLSERAPFVRGDRVRIGQTWPFSGQIGIVRDAWKQQVLVDFEHHEWPVCYRADELERVEEKP